VTLQETLQILGGIGVIASIVYVGIQIRNNARALRAATYQQLSVISMQGWMALAQNGETTEVLLRGFDDFHSLSRVEKARFRFKPQQITSHHKLLQQKPIRTNPNPPKRDNHLSVRLCYTSSRKSH
jgi:hypothetical protein